MEKPNFIIRAVKYHKTALYRQLGEAVRIRRRGGQGSILNSKSEYDRCYIPRLTVEEKDTRELALLEEQEAKKNREQQDEDMAEWDSAKLRSRREQDRAESSRIGTIEVRISGEKREQEQLQGNGRRSKRPKQEVLGEQWGKEQPESNIREPMHDVPPPPPLPREQEGPREQEPNHIPRELLERKNKQPKLTDYFGREHLEPLGTVT